MINLPPSPEGLNDLTVKISKGLSEVRVSGLPLEIADALTRARTEMETIPAVIEDLARAKQTFFRLAETIDSLQELAAKAAALPDDDQKSRERFDAEFVAKAGIVARITGNMDYDGPELRLLSRPQAEAARMALRHLIPGKNMMADNLAKQEKNIEEAIRATMYFLETSAKAFPEALAGVITIIEAVKDIQIH
ncbi:MAG: hypothetical protein JRD68_05835 [Deltaproteobacteria bacterium]|nr:hypothetical protein [Deltaproteobacteria bacterium]